MATSPKPRPRARPRTSSRAADNIERRHETSAGGVIWRRDSSGALELVLIRPNGTQNWALPKGHVEPGEEVQDAAVREAQEETGLEVRNPSPLGDVSYVFSWRDREGGALVRIFKRVHFFLMEHAGGDSSRHDAEVAEVAMLPASEAIDRATYKSERDLLEKARALLEQPLAS